MMVAVNVRSFGATGPLAHLLENLRKPESKLACYL